MRLSFICVVIGFAGSIGLGCSSDSSSGGGTGGSGNPSGTGGNGSGNEDPRCVRSHCDAELVKVFENCQNTLTTPCGKEFGDLNICTASKETCDADGFQDLPAEACKAENDALIACTNAHPGS